MITYNTIIGSKFFKDDKIIRIIKYKNKHLAVARDISTGEQLKLSIDDLSNHYKRLKPIGVFSAFLVDVGYKKKDIICTINRAVDMEKGEKTPFVACRINSYANALETRPGVESIGLCLSQLTTPPNMDFRVLLQNNGINANNVVSIYIDDTIDSILSFFNTVKYDEALRDIQKELDSAKIRNSASNLRELLDLNGFMSEFGNAFNIISLDLDDNDEEPFTMIDDTFCEPKNLADVIITVERRISHRISDCQFIIADEYTNYAFINGYDFVHIRKNDNSNKIYLMRFIKGDPITIKPKDPTVDTYEVLNAIKK